MTYRGTARLLRGGGRDTPVSMPVGARAKGFAESLDNCIVGRMKGWRFPVPKDAGGTATDASFQVALHLVP